MTPEQERYWWNAPLWLRERVGKLEHRAERAEAENVRLRGIEEAARRFRRRWERDGIAAPAELFSALAVKPQEERA